MNKKNIIRIAAICACICIAAVSAVLLVRYAMDYVRTRQLNAVLAAQYHVQSQTPQPTETPVPTAMPTATAFMANPSTPIPTAGRTAYPALGGYVNNPYRQVSEQFLPLRETNPDICGWLSNGDDLDQAVVQRDNFFYMIHDASGARNANGAIFLDEQIRLQKRPTCYILYGHNMKNKTMFGMLHRYDSSVYLHDHAIITFDTIYEEGQFAVFASGTLSIDPSRSRSIRYFDLPNAAVQERSAIVEQLKRASNHQIALEVSGEDQLLILVTCVGDTQERRFLAARRLREGETAAMLEIFYMPTE